MSLPVLVIRNGPDAGARIALSGPMIIGRRGADIGLQDAQVSRRHAEIRPTASGFEVRDLGSANGTRVNGTRLATAGPVAGGDVVGVGQTELELELELELDAVDQPTVIQDVPGGMTVDMGPANPEPVGTVGQLSGAVMAQSPPAIAAPRRRERPFSAPSQGSSGGPATRQPVAIVLTFATIILTGVGLILYFALR